MLNAILNFFEPSPMERDLIRAYRSGKLVKVYWYILNASSRNYARDSYFKLQDKDTKSTIHVFLNGNVYIYPPNEDDSIHSSIKFKRFAKILYGDYLIEAAEDKKRNDAIADKKFEDAVISIITGSVNK